MAVTDLGLSPKEFWRLTWYEWGLYCLKLYKDSKRMLAQRELSIDLTRHFMALFANANSKEEFKPQDFLWKLSYDDKPEEVKPLEIVEVESVERFKKAKEQMGSKIKKDGGE